MSEELKFCPFCKSKQLEVVKIDMKDPGRDLIKCRHCRGQVMRYHWDTRHITKADVEAYCRENSLVMVPDKSIASLLIHAKRLADDVETDTSVNMDFAIEQIEDMIATFRVQGF